MGLLNKLFTVHVGYTLDRHLESALYFPIAVVHSVTNSVEDNLVENASTPSLLVALFLPRFFAAL